MSTNNRVSIQIIPYGLRQEETIVQIATALESIESLVTDVFQQIEDNIVKHRQYLSTLQKRSEIVAAKVDRLAGQNVATTVYSHHNFPSVESSFDSLFQLNLKPVKKKSNVPIQSKFQHAKYNKSLNKLHFFHIKSDTDSVQEELILQQGLGRIPQDVNSVSSLLLFNTSENLYQKYVMLDPLAISNECKPSEDEGKKKDDIAAAPNSILNDYVFKNEDYFKGFYTPPYEEVPTINVPVDLPDLPGIAGNLKFNFGTENPIAPSKQSEEREKPKTIEEISANDLPVISQSKFKSDVPTISETKTTGPPTSVTESVTSVPSPPPLPSSSSAPPPPPPPPMPELEVSTTKDVVATESTPSTAKPNPSVNVHATLMEAIRNAGGKDKAKLRPITETEHSEPAGGSKESDGGAFMGALYARLALRRKGISGQIKESGKKVDIMDRVSALIQPSTDTPDDSEDDDEVTNDWDD